MSSTKNKSPLSPAKEFEKTITNLTGRHHLWRVFSDFCELGAMSIWNQFAKDPEVEKRYHQIREAYEPKEFEEFPRLMSLVVVGLEDLDCDFLGERFMSLELGSHWSGQFFTPFHVSRLMAEMTIGDTFAEVIKERGFATVSEPACGAGGMVLALAAAMEDRGFDYQRDIHVTCVDTDPTAANMCYIQLALHHIPAEIYVGNSLTMKMQSVRQTPAHILGGWSHRLAAHRQAEGIESIVGATEPAYQAAADDQLSLL